MGDRATTIQQREKDIKCRFCADTIFKQFTVFTTDIASAFLNTPIEQEVLVQPPKEYYHNQTHILWSMTKALFGLRTSPKQRQEHLSAILQKLGFTRLKNDECVFINTMSTTYIMAFVDDLHVVGDNDTTRPFLQQFQQHLELKHTICFAQQYYKILKAYDMDKCNPSTTPGNKKPPIAAQLLDKVQHSKYRTAVGQLLWVSQLRADIAVAVKELSRHIKGTTHYKVTLAAPKVEHNEQGQIIVHIESSADSGWAGCDTTRKSTSGAITTCWGILLLHISRTQSTIARSSAEAGERCTSQCTLPNLSEARGLYDSHCCNFVMSPTLVTIDL
eukprot:2692476-Amphidinium_carterae.1